MLLAGASLKLVDDQGAVFGHLGSPWTPVLSFEGEVSPSCRRALADAIRILHSLTAGPGDPLSSRNFTLLRALGLSS